jgi:hypothetical protein
VQEIDKIQAHTAMLIDDGRHVVMGFATSASIVEAGCCLVM